MNNKIYWSNQQDPDEWGSGEADHFDIEFRVSPFLPDNDEVYGFIQNKTLFIISKAELNAGQKLVAIYKFIKAQEIFFVKSLLLDSIEQEFPSEEGSNL